MFRNIFVAIAIVTSFFMQSMAELHHFKIDLPKEAHTKQPFEIKITSQKENNTTEKSLRSVTVRADHRRQSVEEKVTLNNGKGKVTLTLDLPETYIISVSDNEDEKVFSTTALKVVVP